MNEVLATNRFEKALKKLAQRDPKLFAEVDAKIALLEEGRFESLDIAPIKRKKAKHKISEIRIKTPGSFRIFYVFIPKGSNWILLIDGKKKKVNKFKNQYFDDLDKCIDRFMSEVDGN